MKIRNVLLLLCLPFFSAAQQSDLGNWLIYFGNKKINAKWNLHHEVQYRNYNAIGDLEQLLLRTGVGYNLTPSNNNVLLGYGFIQSEDYNNGEKTSTQEHRIFQQFITKQSINRISLQHRYRFEQRMVEGRPLRLRFRYFLSLNVPLNHKQMTDKTFYTSTYTEIFINGNRPSLFDRNRLYGGVGYKLNDRLRFELGYMNQSFTVGSRDQLNVIAFYNF